MSGPSDSSESDGSESSGPQSPLSPNRSPRSPAKTPFSAIGSHLRGVAAFLAPPPQGSATETTATGILEPQLGLIGLCNDLAEIGDSFKTGLTLLSTNKAIAGISKIASNLLQLESDGDRAAERVPGSGDGSGSSSGYGRGVPGITVEVLDFVKQISARPACWTEFPLALEKDFEMSENQRKHALGIEHLAPSLKSLRAELQSSISQEQFWRIYFVLLLSRLEKDDVELLSTPEITEVRNALLQKIDNINKAKILGTSKDATETKGENNPYRAKVVEYDDATVTDYTSSPVDFQNVILEDYFSTGLSSLGPVQETMTSLPTGSNKWVELDVSQSHHKAMQSVTGERESDWVHLNESRSSPKASASEEKDWVHLKESKSSPKASASEEKDWVHLKESKSSPKASASEEKDWVHLSERKSSPKASASEEKDWVHLNESESPKKETESGSGEKEPESDDWVMDDSD